jgi:histidinol-phosphatase (PHP family)
VRLRQEYQGKIKIIIGFEAEWIRPSYSNLIEELATNSNVDFFIGSVHHVHEIPIDYDSVFYNKARDAAGGTDERLFEDYFDSQYEMLRALKPRVVGHFDLIRLLSDDPDRDLKEIKGVWERIERNLKVVVEQGGLIEINSSALRKGLKEPYPGRSVCEKFLKMGGKLTLSDDSHGVAQVGTNFTRAIGYLETLGVEELFVLDGKNGTGSHRGSTSVRSVALSNIRETFRS